MSPTIEQAMDFYRTISLAERAKTGRPCEKTAENTILGTRAVCEAAGVPLSSDVRALDRKAFDRALARFMERGLSRVSAWSYACQTRALFARWCAPYWLDAGWRMPIIELPAFRAVAPRYARPSAETLARVKAWYGTLKGGQWFAATMMLEFAMRNGDVLRLKEENFAETRHGRFLSYVPRKTELSSGRRVFWPVHDDIWRKYVECGRLAGLDVTAETFAEMNKDLRAIGFSGPKASYELRKICIDHVYQNFGAEMAVSISGDDVRTVTRYYADPARPNVGAVRIVDLI